MFEKDEFKSPLDHAIDIGHWFRNWMIPKYMTGQEEHGGRLWRKNTRKALKEEILDIPVYFHQLDRQIEEAVGRLRKSVSIADEDLHLSPDRRWTLVKQALNILETGNPEGEVEEER